MKIIRYQNKEGVVCLGSLGPDGLVTRLRGDLYGKLEPDSSVPAVPPARLLAPVEPAAIICIGLNYRQHAAETGAKIPEYPVVFFKGPNTLQHPECPIELPRGLLCEEVDYECELAVVIGRRCKNVTRATALSYVLGYTCCNDVSGRDWQLAKGGGQWCRGKSFDTFTPLGPCLVTPDEIPDPNVLRLRTFLNGEVMQDSNTSDMIFDVPALIEFLSGSTTLLPGTVILTGTPQGVGMARKPQRWLRSGDRVLIDIEKIGALGNPVCEERLG